MDHLKCMNGAPSVQMQEVRLTINVEYISIILFEDFEPPGLLISVVTSS